MLCSSGNDLLLNFITTNRGGLVGDVKVGGSLSCSDHEVVEFSVGQRGSRTTSNHGFRRANVSLSRDLLGRTP